MTGKLSIIIFLAFLLSLSGRCEAENVSADKSSQLSEASTSADSIVVLYNIIDNSSGLKQNKALEDLYRLAVSRNDENTALDVLRISANVNTSNDSILDVLVERVSSLPAGESQRAAELYIKVIREARQIKALPENIRDKRVRHYLSAHKNIDSSDLYDKIEFLFSLCSYIKASTEGDLFIKYFAELQELIDKLPSRELNLRALFYTRAADSYLNNGMLNEAVAANKILLDIIGLLEKQSKSMGRNHSKYDRAKYLCYRRLLKCHPVLDPEEAETYYTQLVNLPKSTPDIRHDFDINQVPTIFYLMSQKRYAEALPLLVRRIDTTDSDNHEYRYMVKALIKAADALGDNDHLLKALQINNDLLKQRIDEKAEQSYKELQIVYEVNELKQENDDLVEANQQIMVDRHNVQLTYASITLVILLILLVIVWSYYRRAKRLSANLRHSNSVIAGERDALKRAQKELIEARDKAKAADHMKTDFVNNMGHEIRTPLAAIVEYSNLITDCAEDSKRGYIKRFAEIISLNADLLLTLANDVLELPSIENAKQSVRVSATSAKQICIKALDAIRDRVAPDVELIFAKEDAIDVTLTTDPHRVGQVLINLLSNAAKFTEHGTITLDYTLCNGGHDISFSVTDTGIGIPRGKEEVIFSRFEKLNSSIQGNGLGLYIGKLMAGLLKGELRLDTAYHKGARFVFTIPVNHDAKTEK